MDIFLLAFSAALNPTLLAATTVMLLLPRPRNLMLGYLLGAMMTSISLGLVIVFSLEGSGAVEVAKNTLGPVGDIVLGAILLIVARVLSAERDAILRERRERHKAAKGKAKKREGPAALAAGPESRHPAHHLRRRSAPDPSGRLLSGCPDPPGEGRSRHGGDRARGRRLQPDHAGSARAAAPLLLAGAGRDAGAGGALQGLVAPGRPADRDPDRDRRRSIAGRAWRGDIDSFEPSP